jgi:hypothetical protein
LGVELKEKRSAAVADPIRSRVAFDDARRVESTLIELRRSWLQSLVQIAPPVAAGRIGRRRTT